MMPVYADFIKKHYEKFRDYFYLIPVADKELLPIINKYFDGEDLPIKIAEQSMKDFYPSQVSQLLHQEPQHLKPAY